MWLSRLTRRTRFFLMLIFKLLAIIFLLFLFHSPIHAVYDPLSVPNNKYGIHVAELMDLPDAAALVNSNNGDWGYITLVIQDGDKNTGKWQEVFNTMRRLHLIPIIRLATHPEGDSWKIPQTEDAKRWVNFLDALNWPTENRYIILFNEPNHRKEWGNTINPEEYADIALFYAKALKEKSQDFFILPAGLDMSAISDGDALEGSHYVERMYKAQPELLSIIDGWTSHSYPNPGFSSSPYATGKGTIASFQWELKFLKDLGVTKNFPVFITETGWIQRATGNNLALAASGVWTDSRIAAITPFLLNYQGSPFDNFSWKKLNSREFHPQYSLYQKITKIKGEPNQRESFTLAKALFPNELVTNSTYTLESEITNTGQGILNSNDGYKTNIEGIPDGFTYFSDPLPLLEPSEKGLIRIHLKTPMEEGTYHLKTILIHGNQHSTMEEKDVTLIPPPTLVIETQVGWKKEGEAHQVQILVYNQKDELLHKFQDLTIKDGSVAISGLYNTVPGETYRIVVIIPYYLPRQTKVVLKNKKMEISMKRLLPLDLNNDGALNILDLPALLFTKPHEVFGRFF